MIFWTKTANWKKPEEFLRRSEDDDLANISVDDGVGLYLREMTVCRC